MFCSIKGNDNHTLASLPLLDWIFAEIAPSETLFRTSMYHNNQLHTTIGLVSGFLYSPSPDISIKHPRYSFHADLLQRLLRCSPPNRPFNLLNSTTPSQGVWIHLDMTAMEFSSSAPNHTPLVFHPLSYPHLHSLIPSKTRSPNTHVARDLSVRTHLLSRPANSLLWQIISTSGRQAPFHNDQTLSHPPNTPLTNKRLKALRKSAMYRWSGIGQKSREKVTRVEEQLGRHSRSAEEPGL